MLFPDGLKDVVSTWRLPPKYNNRDTGLLQDPKRILMNEVSQQVRRYRESDASTVVSKAIANGHVAQPGGTNRSWRKFRVDADSCCDQHIR